MSAEAVSRNQSTAATCKPQSLKACRVTSANQKNYRCCFAAVFKATPSSQVMWDCLNLLALEVPPNLLKMVVPLVDDKSLLKNCGSPRTSRV